MSDGDQVNSFWVYEPSRAAAGLFLALFTLTGLWHVIQNFQLKAWKVTFLYPWGAILFIVGFITRIIGTYQPENLTVYILSSVFVLVAPPVYEGAQYFILGRILYYVPYHSPIHPGRVVTTFLGFDLVIGAITGTGAAYVANPKLAATQQNVGKALLKAALILQIVCMVSYIAIAVVFQRRTKKGGVLNKPLKAALNTLYLASTIIICRTIYRTYEYFSFSSSPASNGGGFSLNNFSPVLKHEWFFYVFEAMLMFFVSVLINIRHPLKHLPRNNKIYLATDGVTEIEGPGYLDKRPFLVSLLDPFDLAGLIKGKDKKQRFWETHDDVPRKSAASTEPLKERV